MPLVVNSQTACTWNNSGFTWDDLSANQNWNANYIYVWTLTEPETLNFEEEQSDALSLLLAETLNFVEVFLTGHAIAFDEPLNFAEGNSNVATFLREIAETLNFAEDIAKSFTLRKAEAFTFDDLMIRQGPVVVGNLAIRSDLLSFAAFLTKVAEGVSGAWLPYRPFVPGDYDFEKALVRVRLTRDNVSQDVRLTVGKIYADMADVVESRNTTISSAAAVTAVTFTKTFKVVPVITVQLVSTSQNAKARISNATFSGFDVEIVDETNTRITGTVGWIARGY